MQIVIIGGSDAGVSAALRACEINSAAEVTVVVADAFPNYSICGLPFYLSGEVPDWRSLAHRTLEELESTGARFLLNHTAHSVDPAAKVVTANGQEGSAVQLKYDRLVIATGATPIRPPIIGLDLPCVFLLHTMKDSFRVHEYLTNYRPQSAVIVGAGYIGLEMSDALTLHGMRVTLVGRSVAPLPTVDAEIGNVVEADFRRHGVDVANVVEVKTIEAEGTRLTVKGSQSFSRSADMVLVAAGVRPSAELAASIGARTGIKGAICVDREMRTSVSDVFAACDCVETWHRVTEKNNYLPLGTTAHKQGRVAGENTLGGHREFAGSLGTQVVKVFEQAAARTGLRDEEARAAGFDPLTVESRSFDHKVYYPGAQKLLIRVTGDRPSGKLIGAQIIGHWQAEVAKRIDIFATALFHGMRVEEVNDLDLSYTPPLGSPWDAVQVSAQEWAKAL
jgi:NADPH-dependent 2,4-dienoyl-CoA reductase/sulfur reductase-like enzyme